MTRVISEDDRRARESQKGGVTFLKKICLLDVQEKWCVGACTCVGGIRDR